MTGKECLRYEKLKEKFKGDSDLLEFLSLEILYLTNEASVSKDNDDIKKIIGISDLRVRLSSEEESNERV